MNKKVFLLTLLFITTSLLAEVQDKFKINLGMMYVTSFNTEMQISDERFPASVGVHTDQLNIENDDNVFRLDGYYRFTDTHSIDFSYFYAHSKGSTIISQDMDWNGNTIIAGGHVDSYFDMDVYKVSYGYSFYHNEKIELMLTAGLHITDLDLGIGAYGTIVDRYGNVLTGDSYESSESLTVPLPVVGFKGEYTIIDKRLFVNYKVEYFYMKYDDYEGRIVSTALNLEYRFIDNVGVGIGYNSNNIDLEVKNDGNRIDARNELEGAMIYFTYIY